MTNSVMNDVTLKIGCGTLAEFLDSLNVPPSARDRVIAIDRELAAALDAETVDHDRCSQLVLEVSDRLARCLRGPTSAVDGFDFDSMDWGSGSDQVEEVEHV